MWSKPWHVYAPNVELPSFQETWNVFGQWNILPHAIGTIDGTSHHIELLKMTKELTILGIVPCIAYKHK